MSLIDECIREYQQICFQMLKGTSKITTEEAINIANSQTAEFSMKLRAGIDELIQSQQNGKE